MHKRSESKKILYHSSFSTKGKDKEFAKKCITPQEFDSEKFPRSLNGLYNFELKRMDSGVMEKFKTLEIRMYVSTVNRRCTTGAC